MAGFTKLIQGLDGDPKDFYALAVEAINKRGIPNLLYNWKNEFRLGYGFFGGVAERALVLTAEDERHKAFILAYPYGTNMVISLWIEWVNEARMEDQQKKIWGFRKLDEIWLGCFTDLITEGVHEAITTFVEFVETPEEDRPTPQDIFNVARE